MARAFLKVGVALVGASLGCFGATRFSDHSQAGSPQTWVVWLRIISVVAGGTALNCFLLSWLFAKRHVTFAMLNPGDWMVKK